jgi:mannose-6-phosphate isomerase-like protein (cupin superfamily)
MYTSGVFPTHVDCRARPARACAPGARPDTLGSMLRHIASPVCLQAAGTPPKTIEEFIGRLTTQTNALSIARMISPPGWCEPGQTPEFDEFTVVLRGTLRVETRTGVQDVAAGQAVITPKGEWVRYSTPGPDQAEYLAVCLPAFSPEAVHRDPQ